MKKFYKLIFLTTLIAISFSVAHSENIQNDLLYISGISSYNNNDVVSAKQKLETLITYTDKYPIAYFVLGKIYRKKAYLDLDKAKIAFNKFIDLSKDSKLKAYAKLHLAYISIDQKDYVDALNLAEGIYAELPNDPDVKFCYAIILKDYGFHIYDSRTSILDADKAIKYLKQSLSIRPGIFETTNGFASLLLSLHEDYPKVQRNDCDEIQRLLNKAKSLISVSNGFDVDKSENRNVLVNANQKRYENLCR